MLVLDKLFFFKEKQIMGRSRDRSHSKSPSRSPSRSRSGSLSSTSSGRTAKARDWVSDIYFIVVDNDCSFL